jgi:prepilin-type processing-associated H-X9-DG protein
MSYQTALFLASLSHVWTPVVLMAVVFFAIGARIAGRFEERASIRQLVGKTKITRNARRTLTTLSALSGIVLLVAISHVGCAGIVAATSHCRSNEKKLALGVLQYAQDYDERLPLKANWFGASTAKLSPQDPHEAADAGKTFRCEAASTPASYGINTTLAGISLSKVDSPALTAMIFEADAASPSFTGGKADVARTRHSGGSHIAFMDGHAKRTNASAFDDLLWSASDPQVSVQSSP